MSPHCPCKRELTVPSSEEASQENSTEDPVAAVVIRASTASSSAKQWAELCVIMYVNHSSYFVVTYVLSFDLCDGLSNHLEPLAPKKLQTHTHTHIHKITKANTLAATDI